MKHKTEWFQDWFNTTYYHLLYDYRNEEEAEYFMSNLLKFLNLTPSDTILDLPCGRGRHSLFLNSQGHRVIGADISENSISHARHFENQNLRFMIHDMRDPLKERYNAIFNLFTSFGYFENEDCNLHTITSIKSELNEFGFGVIDFMNVNYVIENLVAEDTKIVEGITFHQKRSVKDGYIVKDISFESDGEHFEFQERVKALTLEDFKVLFEHFTQRF